MNDITERIMYKIKEYIVEDKRIEDYRNNGKEYD